jgi:Dockerin type I domain/RTX calcium-binding nonapeptide repeat (4 copies)
VRGSDLNDIIYGGAGNDILMGGIGSDTQYGEDGNDNFGNPALTADGVADDAGTDFSHGGAGFDNFVWEPGDGPDFNNGGDDGADIFRFFGNAGANTFTLREGGTPTHFNALIGALVIDNHGIEDVIVDGQGGADTFTVNDLFTTEVVSINLNLGAADAGAVDPVTINGRPLADRLLLSNPVAGAVRIAGLKYNVNVTNAEATDRLTVNGNEGDDEIIVGLAVNDVLALTVNGNSGNDLLDANATLAAAGSIVFNGGSGNDTLIGGGDDDEFDGGTGDDTFVGNGGADNVGAGGSDRDTILLAGTSGADTFVLSLSATGQLNATVNGLTTTYANFLGGPIATSGINQILVQGLAGNDSLTVDSTNGAIPILINFDGGNNADLLTLTGGTATSDTYAVGPNVTEGTSSIVIGGVTQVVRFNALEPVIDLVAGPLVVHATNADNAINYSQGSVAANGRVSIDGFETIEFSNKTNLTINALAGSDTISLNNSTAPIGLTAITINGGDPTVDKDVAIVSGTTGADTINFAPTTDDDAGITGAGPVPITLATVESTLIDGQGGSDTLTYTSPAGIDLLLLSPGTDSASGVITGGQNNAPFATFMPLSFQSVFILGSTLSFVDVSGTRTDTLAILGTQDDDAFDVSVAGVVTVSEATTGIVNVLPTTSTLGIARLSLLGVDGDDRFTVPGNHPFTANLGRPGLIIEGGNPDSGSDVLNFAGAGAAITANLAARTVTETGFSPVAITGIETVNIAAAGAALSANLTENDDELTYRPTGATSGTFHNENDNTTFNFTNVAGAFTINSLASVGDHVIVEGTNSRDRILIDSPNRNATVTDATGTALKTVTLAVDVELLTAKGRLGNDTFLVVPAPTVGAVANGNLLVNVDGGQPGASDALVIATAAGTTLPATDFAVNAIGLNPGEGRVRVYRNAVATPDISYTNVEIISPNVVVTNGVPQLLVLGPDASEPNEFRTNATHLGSGQTLNVDNLAIFPDAAEHPGVPADVDFFQLLATNTGTLDVTILFETYPVGLLPGGGQLGLNILDVAGNVIGGATTFGTPDASPNARVRIPAVAGQIYFVRVFGANADGTANNAVVNGYELTAINVAPPVPFDLELLDNPVGDPPPANSDTGRSQFDNVTRDNTPTIVFRLDDAFFLNDLPGNDATDTPPDQVIPIPFQAAAGAAGYRVAIFDEGNSPAPGNQTGTAPQTPLGFATFVSAGVYQFITPALTDGSHFLTARVQMIDPATPQATGFGPRSQSLEIIVDTVIPPGFFGQMNLADTTQGLAAESDSGVVGQIVTFADRVTNDTTPEFYGRAEADTIVRLFTESNGVAGLQSTGANSDLFLGLTTTEPLDGSNQFPGGQWKYQSPLDLNNPALGFTKDGVRTIYVTAEDVAGNVTADAAADTLNIFLDTAGPQVTNVQITGSPAFNLFGLKATNNTDQGPTPAVNSLTISLRDLPNRSNVDPNFLYEALVESIAEQRGNIVVQGDHSGIIQITSINAVNDLRSNGNPATATIRLNFAAPLPDDRYTLTILDSLVDPVGNNLDGESNAAEPNGGPIFPSGDSQPKTNFVSRFTVDSRPEVGTVSQGLVYVDINGNFVFDPEGQDNDATNRDFVYQFGTVTDGHFAGNFSRAGQPASGFDKLGVYGFFNGAYSFSLDTNDDGVADFSSAMPAAYQVNGIAVAGNFSNAKSGDEIGLFDGQFWYLDINGNNQIDLGERIASNANGIPVVGDFNGDGSDDLALFNNDTNTFTFDTDRNGTVDFSWAVTDDVNRFRGLKGFTDKPVAGDLNLDGVDDIGLWVKAREGADRSARGEFFFWVSDRVVANPANVFNAYSPAPLGNDLFIQYGSDLALPVFGNFDPPVSSSTGSLNANLTNQVLSFDVNQDGQVTPIDALIVINALKRNGTIDVGNQAVRLLATNGGLYWDVSGDGSVNPIDVLQVINHLNRQSGGSGEGESYTAAVDMAFTLEESSVAQAVDQVFSDTSWSEELRKRRNA